MDPLLRCLPCVFIHITMRRRIGSRLFDLRHVGGRYSLPSLTHPVISFFSGLAVSCCRDRCVLLGQFAKHHETGETLPTDLFNKLCAQRTYMAGSTMLRQLYFGQVCVVAYIYTYCIGRPRYLSFSVCVVCGASLYVYNDIMADQHASFANIAVVFRLVIVGLRLFLYHCVSSLPNVPPPA